MNGTKMKNLDGLQEMSKAEKKISKLYMLCS